MRKLILDLWSSSPAAAPLQKCNSTVLVADYEAHKLEARNSQVRSSLLVSSSMVELSNLLVELLTLHAVDEEFLNND